MGFCWRSRLAKLPEHCQVLPGLSSPASVMGTQAAEQGWGLWGQGDPQPVAGPWGRDHLPCQPLGVSHDEADAPGMAEVPDAELLLQWGLGQHHHLHQGHQWVPLSRGTLGHGDAGSPGRRRGRPPTAPRCEPPPPRGGSAQPGPAGMPRHGSGLHRSPPGGTVGWTHSGAPRGFGVLLATAGCSTEPCWH